MHSPKRLKYARANTPEGLRRRRAAADARREALASTIPPACAGPEPLTLWQRLTVDLYVPTAPSRCDQFAAMLDGKRIGLRSATEVGVLVRRAIRKRPSLAVLGEWRRDEWMAAMTRTLSTDEPATGLQELASFTAAKQ